MKKPYFIIALMLISVIVSSCSKKDSNPAAPQNTDGQTNNLTEPFIPKLSFSGPATSASNDVINQIKTYASAVNDYSMALSSLFGSVQPTNSGNEWKWVLSPADSATVTFTATKNSDGSFSWNVIKNGKIGSISYNNWKAIDGTISADGKKGGWKVYGLKTEEVIAWISWSADNIGNTGSLSTYENSVLKSKIEIFNNSNKSGYVKYYGEGPTLFWQANWTSSGTGTWKTYNHGTEINSGKF